MQVFQRACADATRFEDSYLDVDFQRKTVRLDSRVLTLTRKEYELLELLVRSAGEVVLRSEILTKVWGYSAAAHTRTLDVHVGHLRTKLGFRGRYIQTVCKFGYRFEPCYEPAMPEVRPHQFLAAAVA
jgi:DNA-binding response OmpR family regulator